MKCALTSSLYVLSKFPFVKAFGNTLAAFSAVAGTVISAYDSAFLLAAPSTVNLSFHGLDHLVLSPASASISLGGSETYTVEGYDAANDDLGPVTDATLAISPDGSCTGYTCTATTAGPHTVTATDVDATGTATLTVGATGTYPISFTASVNIPFDVNAGGGDITVTGAEAVDCNNPSYTQSFCAYDFTGVTGALYGIEQDGTDAPCSVPAQNALNESDAGYFEGVVKLGNPPDGNGGIGIVVEAGAPDRTDVDGGCAAGMEVGSPGETGASVSDLSSPWVPGSQTSSWTVYADSLGPGATTPAGTFTMNWQY